MVPIFDGLPIKCVLQKGHQEPSHEHSSRKARCCVQILVHNNQRYPGVSESMYEYGKSISQNSPQQDVKLSLHNISNVPCYTCCGGSLEGK